MCDGVLQLRCSSRRRVSWLENKKNMKFLQLSLALCILGVLAIVQRCVNMELTYDCRYGEPRYTQPGPILSVYCNETTALVTWNLTDLNTERELEHLYVERDCIRAINPTNTTEWNTTNLTNLTGPVHELYDGVKMLVSSVTVPTDEKDSCRYFGCVRPSKQQTWYTFNTASCVPSILMSSALPSTSLIELMRTVEPVSHVHASLTSDGTSMLLTPTIFMSTPVSTGRGWLVLPLVIAMTSMGVVALLLLLLVCIIARRRSRSRILLHKYSITTPGQDVVDLNFSPVSPTLMETMSTSSEYSEFDKLYASEVDRDTTDEDGISNILKTDSLNSSNSSSHSPCQSDASAGYIILPPDKITEDSTDLCISTDECCDSSSKLGNSISTQLDGPSAKQLKAKHTSECATTEHQRKVKPAIMEQCPRTGDITYQHHQQGDDNATCG